MVSTRKIDYLASHKNRIWLGDCKIQGQILIVYYAYFSKGITEKEWVFREDGKGYLIEIPAELRMLATPVNFFRRVEFEIVGIKEKQPSVGVA